MKKVLLIICCLLYCQAGLASGESFIMPDVIGLDKDVAKQKIIEACGTGRMCTRSQMYTPYKNTLAPNNCVFRIQPAPGETFTSNDDLRIDFSVNSITPEKFKSLKPIPNVIGMTKEEATKALNNAGWESFTPGGFSTHKIGIDYVGVDPTNSFRNGTVIKAAYSQDGWAVNLTILKKDTIPMPDLIGKSYTAAEKILKDTGLFKEVKREEIIYSVEFLKQNPSRASELHTVVRVVPKAGTMINPDTDNYVWVAEGIPEAEKSIQVPNIAQLKEADAVAKLKQLGLIPQITYEKTFDAFLGGTASVKTDPGQGRIVKAGDTVKITIYLYKPKVPFLQSNTQQDAIDKLTALGLKYKLEYKSTAVKSLDNQVAEYAPAAQTQVEPGSIVTLVLYKFDRINIPYLVGMAEQKAVDFLKENKSDLKYSVQYEDTVYTTEAGKVFKTAPEYKTTVEPGDTLTLYVKKLLASVPDVKGKTESNAVSVLENSGFDVRKTYLDSKEVGKVIDQSQKAGEAVKGVVITIIVGKKPDDIKLPDLKGKSQQEAINTILASNTFSYVIKNSNVYESAKNGIVTSTYPIANAMVPPDSQVTIYIGKYVGNIPNVVGLSEHEAKIKLSQSGFAGIVLYTSQGIPGRVLNQKPDAGSTPVSGAKANFVNIYVTRTQAEAENQYNPYMEAYVIPYLEGLSLMEARNRLAANKINFVIDEIQTGRDRHDKILGTYPPRGVKLNPNQILSLKVGKEYYAVPNLIGMTGFKATSIIHQNRMQARYTGDPTIFKAPAKRTSFKKVPLISRSQSYGLPSSSSSTLNDTSGNAIVIHQNPKPGVPKQGAYIEITLAYDVKVPEIMDKSFSEAIYQIRENALRYDIEYVPVKEGSKSGKVLNMAPPPGQPVPVGTMVRMQIGKITDIVPDVIGKSENEADAILKNLNFYAEKEYISPSKSNNVVIAQGQNPGARRGPSNIKLILGTQDEMASIITPTPVIMPKAMASVQAAAPKTITAQGAPPPQAAPAMPQSIPALSMTFEETNVIKELYTNLKQAYADKDEYQLVNLLSSNWESPDGSTVQDVEDNLRNKFTVFDNIECNISNLTINKTASNIYRASYDIEITGEIFDSNISRKEKSSVSEEIITKNGKPKINRTLSGQFWYRE